MPLKLDDGWNNIQLNLADLTKRAYGTNYVETLRVQVHANCRLRRIYFSDRLYSEEELPPEFKLYLPIQVRTPLFMHFVIKHFFTPIYYIFLCELDRNHRIQRAWRDFGHQETYNMSLWGSFSHNQAAHLPSWDPEKYQNVSVSFLFVVCWMIRLFCS